MFGTEENRKKLDSSITDSFFICFWNGVKITVLSARYHIHLFTKTSQLSSSLFERF